MQVDWRSTPTTSTFFREGLIIKIFLQPFREVKVTRSTFIERDYHEWKLNEFDPFDKDMWRSSVRSAMRAASQLHGGEPTDVEDASAHAR